MNGTKYEVVSESTSTDSKSVRFSATNGEKTSAAVNSFLASLGKDVADELKTARDVNGYMVSFDGSAVKATRNGQDVVVANKLQSGFNLTDGVFGNRITALRFKTFSDAVNSTGATTDFGVATVVDGSTSYTFNSIAFDNATKVFNIKMNNTDDVKVKLNGTTIYVSSTGDLKGIGTLVKAVIGGNVVEK